MGLQFEPKVSLGNMFSIAMVIIAAALGYGKMTESHEMLQKQVNVLVQDNKDLRDMKAQYSLQEYQLRVVNEKLEEIKADMKEVKRFVK
jgi:spore coat protein CotH